VLLESEELLDNNTSIGVEGLTSGIYFLKVITQEQEVKTFKIIKR